MTYAKFIIFSIYFLFDSYVLVKADLNHDEVLNLLLETSKQCPESKNLTNNNIMKAFTKQFDDNQRRCLVTCTLLKLKLLNSRGVFNIQELNKFARKIQNKPSARMDLNKALLEKCSRKFKDLNCDRGAQIYDCAREVLLDYWTNN